MAEGALAGVVLWVAVAGVLALIRRAFGSLLRLALHAAEATAASGLAEVSARRGDLTGLSERRAHRERARRLRRTELLLLSLWAGWIVVPALAGWTPDAYLPAALLWLLPRGRSGAIVVRRGGSGQTP